MLESMKLGFLSSQCQLLPYSLCFCPALKVLVLTHLPSQGSVGAALTLSSYNWTDGEGLSFLGPFSQAGDPAPKHWPGHPPSFLGVLLKTHHRLRSFSWWWRRHLQYTLSRYLIRGLYSQNGIFLVRWMFYHSVVTLSIPNFCFFFDLKTIMSGTNMATPPLFCLYLPNGSLFILFFNFKLDFIVRNKNA